MLGNIPIAYLTYPHNRDVIIVFKKSPFHWTRKYPDKSLKELLELKHVKLIGTSTVSKCPPKYFPPFQLGNQTKDTRENIFQGKLEPLRKKQVIEKYFTQDELDLVLGDSLEKDSLDKNRPDQYWILNSNILIHLPNQ